MFPVCAKVVYTNKVTALLYILYQSTAMLRSSSSTVNKRRISAIGLRGNLISNMYSRLSSVSPHSVSFISALRLPPNTSHNCPL